MEKGVVLYPANPHETHVKRACCIQKHTAAAPSKTQAPNMYGIQASVSFIIVYISLYRILNGFAIDACIPWPAQMQTFVSSADSAEVNVSANRRGCWQLRLLECRCRHRRATSGDDAPRFRYIDNCVSTVAAGYSLCCSEVGSIWPSVDDVVAACVPDDMTLHDGNAGC